MANKGSKGRHDERNEPGTGEVEIYRGGKTALAFVKKEHRQIIGGRRRKRSETGGGGGEEGMGGRTDQRKLLLHHTTLYSLMTTLTYDCKL